MAALLGLWVGIATAGSAAGWAAIAKPFCQGGPRRNQGGVEMRHPRVRGARLLVDRRPAKKTYLCRRDGVGMRVTKSSLGDERRLALDVNMCMFPSNFACFCRQKPQTSYDAPSCGSRSGTVGRALQINRSKLSRGHQYYGNTHSFSSDGAGRRSCGSHAARRGACDLRNPLSWQVTPGASPGAMGPAPSTRTQAALRGFQRQRLSYSWPLSEAMRMRWPSSPVPMPPGRGCPRIRPRRFAGPKRAADTGLPFGLHALALDYFYGTGVPVDHGRYLDILRKAADAGSILAASEYSQALFVGAITPRMSLRRSLMRRSRPRAAMRRARCSMARAALRSLDTRIADPVAGDRMDTRLGE